MNKIFIALILLLLLPVFMAMVLSLMSRQPPALGLQAGKLLPCGTRQNCVCSEYNSAAQQLNQVPPLDANGLNLSEIQNVLMELLKQSQGDILEQSPVYMRVAFSTPLLKFVDDVEFRIDMETATVQVRSASRVGHSDFGTNGKRIENLRHHFAEIADKSRSAGLHAL